MPYKYKMLITGETGCGGIHAKSLYFLCSLSETSETMLSMMKSNNKFKNIFRQMTMKNTTTQDLWDAVKAVLTEKFIPIWAFFKKQTKNLK